MNCDHLRQLAKNALQDLSYDAAGFFANKLVTLEPSNPENALLLAQSYYNTAQYKRAAHFLTTNYLPRPTLNGTVEMPKSLNPIDTNILSYLQCLHLASKAYAKMAQWQDCIELLQNFDLAMASRKIDVQDKVEKAYAAMKSEKRTNILSSLFLLRAEAFESMDIRNNSIDWYKKALVIDVTCYEAWRRLSEGQMLAPIEESRFLASLHFNEDQTWLKAIYISKTSEFAVSANVVPLLDAPSSTATQETSQTGQVTIKTPSKPSISTEARQTEKIGIELVNQLDSKFKLGSNEDVIAGKAQAFLYANQIRKAFALTSSVIDKDPYATSVLTTHLTCLVELGMKNELYLLAHKLAESAPKSAFSWYAVGCYYFLTRSWQNARLYFGKATALKREFGAAWLAYGYTFAQNGDHDQALSAYRTAARLLVGSHLPTLFIATELTRAKDTVLALEFAKRAAEMQPNDPYPIHELGVIHYRCREYPQAIACFQRAINLIGKKNIDEVWESTIFNLGQAHMKLSHYESAIEHFEWSLALLPHNASTYSALAVAHHVLGNLSEAIELYHQVLSITPDDAFATDALEDALHEWVVQRGTGLLQEGDVELDMSE